MSHYVGWFLQVFSLALSVLLFGGLIWLCIRRWRIARGKPLPPIRPWRALLTFALAGDVLMTVILTLISRGTVTMTQFHPLASWWEAWNAWSPHLFAQLFLNIGVFVPFGALLSLRFARLRRVWAVGVISFGFSLGIETLQLIFQRGVFDVDDLLCNTLGGILGGALVCFAVHLHGRRPWRAALAALPILAGGAACALFFGSYAAQPYGNLAIAPNYRYPMRGVAFTTETELADEPSTAPVFVKRSFTAQEAVAAAEGILAGLGLSATDGVTEHFTSASCFNFADDGVYLTYDRDGSWYLCHDAGGARPAPAIGSAEALAGWLSGFGLDLADADIVYAGRRLWHVTPAQPANGAPAGSITCTFYDDGAWTVEADTPSLVPVAVEPILTPAEAAAAIREGRFRWFYDQMPSFSSLSLRGLTLVYRTDTKGYQVPVWQASLTVDGQNAAILIPALK
ncbi:MAG: VanZ family protein [Clostridia bacterium]|nr:VanZ family protein [Clostridia bacterium]